MGENMHNTHAETQRQIKINFAPNLFTFASYIIFQLVQQTTTAFRMLNPKDDASLFYQTREVAEYWVLINQ